MPTPADIRVQLVRNATLLATVDGTTFLVDPMLSPQGANPPIQNTPNDRRNPLVPMPDVDLSYDAVVVTHRHTDHWDDAAMEAIGDDVPLFCQPEDAAEFTDEGFTDVRPVDDETTFQGITIHRTPGQHGHGDLAEQMAPVSGFVFVGEQTLYVAGDTIWYDAVDQTLAEFDPDVVVLNGGEARFEQGDPITMGVSDVNAVREATDATVAVVHMEAINHCLLSRETLRSETNNVRVLDDGATLSL